MPPDAIGIRTLTAFVFPFSTETALKESAAISIIDKIFVLGRMKSLLGVGSIILELFGSYLLIALNQ